MNSFRHGKATLVRIFLVRDGDRIVLSLRDNGLGAGGFVEGIGLAGMRERLARSGGSLAAASVPGGFEVRAHVPIKDGAAR
jgi:signal transduction histidine kinase